MEKAIKRFYYWLHKRSYGPEERDEPSGGVWHRRVRREVINLCRMQSGRLLEVGCGEGLFIANLAAVNAQLEICGVDNNTDKLQKAKKWCEDNGLKKVKFLYTDALNLPAEDGWFDCVVCINTFFNVESINTVNRILGQIARVCKNKGRIVFDFRNSLNPFLRLKYKLAPHYDPTVKEYNLPLNTYSPKDIDDILKRLNLTVLNRKYIGFPLKFLAPIVIIEAEKC